VGNGVTDDYHDYIGTFEYWWSHGLISDSTYKSLRGACESGSSEHPSIICNNALDKAQQEFGNIDPYSIYTRPCNNTGSLKGNLRGRYVSDENSLILGFQLNVIQTKSLARYPHKSCPHPKIGEKFGIE